MKPLDTFARELAEQVLGRHCSCYGDAYPAPSCDTQARAVALAIAGAYRSHATPEDTAKTILETHCACHETLRDVSTEGNAFLAREVDRTAATIQAAFDARHLEEAHAEAIAADIKGG